MATKYTKNLKLAIDTTMTPSAIVNLEKIDAAFSNFKVGSDGILRITAPSSILLQPNEGTTSGTVPVGTPDAPADLEVTGDIYGTSLHLVQSGGFATVFVPNPSATAELTWMFPPSYGTSGQILARDTEAGRLKWIDVPSPVPALTKDYIFIGNNANIATPFNTTSAGDIEASFFSGLTIKEDAVKDEHLVGNIALSKLAILDAGKVLITSSGGVITTSSVTATELAGFSSAIGNKLDKTLADGNFWVGNASNLAAPVLMSGDASMTSAGVVTVSASSIYGKILSGFVTGPNAAIANGDSLKVALQKAQGQLDAKLSAALTYNYMWVGNATGVPIQRAVATVVFEQQLATFEPIDDAPVDAGDTILQALEKLQAQINGVTLHTGQMHFVEADWVGPSAGYWSITFSHNLQATEVIHEIRDAEGLTGVEFFDILSWNQVRMRVPAVPDCRFAGVLIVTKVA